MARSAAAPLATGLDRRARRLSLAPSRSKARPVPVERLLPPAVIRELRGMTRSTAEITPAFAKTVDERFHITDRCGVTRRRLLNYLGRLKREGRPAGGSNGCEKSVRDGDPWQHRLSAHRRRQASVASILEATFGGMAECSPELWDRRAYLMLVGLVYERLATNEAEIPTEELVRLARVLAENRRAEVRACRKKIDETPDDVKPGSSGRLPERFADLVRQVYGTNFHDPAATPATGEPERGGR